MLKEILGKRGWFKGIIKFKWFLSFGDLILENISEIESHIIKKNFLDKLFGILLIVLSFFNIVYL